MFRKIFSWQVSLCFFVIFFVCGIVVNTIGSSVDEQGILHEPFAFIAIGGISLYLGLIVGAAFLIRLFMNRVSRHPRVS